MHKKNFVAVWLILVALAVSSCAPVTPRITDTTEASWSGNVQNSGIVLFDQEGAIVDQNGFAYYSDLVKNYGKKISPPVKDTKNIVKMTENRWRFTYQDLQVWYALKLKAGHIRIDDSGKLINKVL